VPAIRFEFNGLNQFRAVASTKDAKYDVDASQESPESRIRADVASGFSDTLIIPYLRFTLAKPLKNKRCRFPLQFTLKADLKTT
jgi:hypothetical protein